MLNKNKPVEQIAPEQHEKKKKLPVFFLRRVLPLLAVLAIVLLVSVLSTMLDDNHFTALRRYLKYGNSSETQDLYTYASHQRNLFEPLGDELLVVNPYSIQILHEDGTTLYELQVNLNSPMLSGGAELAAVCDAGGDTVYVLSSAGLRWTHVNADQLLCYSVRVCGDDHVVIVEQKFGYKASVCVYDKEGTLVFRFDSHDRYLSDAIVTKDGQTLAVLAPGEDGGTFSSSLIVYDLATAQRKGVYPVVDGLGLDIAVTSSQAMILCDDRLSIVSFSGELLLDYPYEELYLHDYTLGSSDFCALLLSRYQSSNVCTLTTFSPDGEILAQMNLSDEVLDISAAGDRLAVLYSDTLVLYDRTLNEVARLNGTEHAGIVRMDHDGTALLIAETSARRFLP